MSDQRPALTCHVENDHVLASLALTALDVPCFLVTRPGLTIEGRLQPRASLPCCLEAEPAVSRSCLSLAFTSAERWQVTSSFCSFYSFYYLRYLLPVPHIPFLLLFASSPILEFLKKTKIRVDKCLGDWASFQLSASHLHLNMKCFEYFLLL